MSELLGSIGSFFGSSGGKGIMDIAGLAGTGLGLAGNISAEQQAQQQRNYLTQQEQANASLTPAQLASKVSAATAPLNAGLVQSVENNVSGNLAEQGLSEAPGIQASVLAQALAPYQQQNQNTALQLVMQQLGLPIQYGQAILGNQPQQANLSPLLAMLMRQNNPTQPTGTPSFLTTDSDYSGITPQPPSNNYSGGNFDPSSPYGGVDS
jgi:hypothetical protein